MRARRIFGVPAAGFLVATFAWPVERPEPVRPRLAAMTAEPVALDEGDPERRRLGALHFLEGWRLSSRDVRFGGVSAMHVEGGEVLALGDSGGVFRFPVPRGAGALPLRIDRIPRGPGSARRKSDRDAEAAAVAGGGLGGVENWNAVGAIAPAGASAAAAPEALRGLPFARGPKRWCASPRALSDLRQGPGRTGDDAPAAVPRRPARPARA